MDLERLAVKNGAELARRSGINSRQVVSRLLAGARHPAPETVVAVAEGLDLDPIYVFRLAGYLPPEEPPDLVAQEIGHIVAGLPAPSKQALLYQVRALRDLARRAV